MNQLSPTVPTVAAGDITNKAMMATCLAVVLLMVTFAYVTDLEESDAVEIGGITKIGSLDYLVVDGTVRHDDSMFDGHSRIYVTTSGDSTEIAADAFNGCDSIDMIQIDDKIISLDLFSIS